MPGTITINGAMGEGGGQVLRTSLTLSLITGRPVVIENIRAGRRKPGLMRQHLASVRAAAEISDAKVGGDRLGGKRLVFDPGRVSPGGYEFSVGTAGSAGLVFQTVLPALMIADGESRLVLEGGTHNPFSPPFDFLDRAYLPLISRMGPGLSASIERYGFYPAGGGRFTARIRPVKRLDRLDILDRGRVKRIRARACVARLSPDIARRELSVVRDRLGLGEENLLLQHGLDSPGPGNYLAIEVESENITACFTGFGTRGVPAERVAGEVVGEVEDYLDSGAPVDGRLADQILVPMVLAGGGGFRTTEPTLHTRTNIEVIRLFFDADIRVRQEGPKTWAVCIENAAAK